MNALPDGPGFHIVRWVDANETHFVAQRVSWGSEDDEWQMVDDERYYTSSRLLDYIGEAFLEVWRWDE